jgi:hypothetical protein
VCVCICITYIQATINSSWSTFRNLKDKQRHILKFSTTTNAESKATRATTQLYSMILLVICSNNRFLLLTTYTKLKINCEGLLHQYGSNLFVWTISFTSNTHGKHQHVLIRKMMKGNNHEITNIRYSCTSTHHKDIQVDGWSGDTVPLHLNLGTRSKCAGSLMPRLLYSLQTATWTHWSVVLSVPQLASTLCRGQKSLVPAVIQTPGPSTL